MDLMTMCPCPECSSDERLALALDSALVVELARLRVLQELRAQHQNKTGIVLRFPIERTTAKGDL